MTTQINDISALRDVLFETLRGLKDDSVSPEKARAINETGQTIINSAKLEVEFIKATGARSETGFVQLVENPAKSSVTATPTGTKIVDGGSTVHRLRG
ncbi:MAG: hypothetical protein Q8O79_00965 [Pseudomonadota bacterium]|nr:hypothetical protein [Pseudomonadota bacterium]